MNKIEVRSNTEFSQLRMSPKAGLRRTSNGYKENIQYEERKEKNAGYRNYLSECLFLCKRAEKGAFNNLIKEIKLGVRESFLVKV